MNLSFDNLEEFDRFLRWADLYRMAGAQEPAVPGVDGSAGLTFPVLDVRAVSAEAPAATDTGTGYGLDAPQGDTKADDAPANGEKKRKRRTKAEIEADERAAQAANAARVAGGHVDVARVVNTDGTVTTTSVGLPPDVNPAEVTAAPTGANPFEQPATGGAEPIAAPTETVDEVPNAEVGEEVVTPFQHLTAARAFIAKHGMPKYNETFAKAGLDPNVMAYTAYQRGVHMATMGEMDKG